MSELSTKKNENPLKNFTKDIEIKLNTLITKSQTPLNNFYLLGHIKKGKF